MNFKTLKIIIKRNYIDQKYTDIHSLKTIDNIRYSIEQGIESNIYHFHPVTPNNKVILYHQGDFYNSKKQIKFFLDKGYSVIAFLMPLIGMNNKPIINNSRLGHIKLTNHEVMKFIELKIGHPIKFFIEPIIKVLDYLEESYKYDSVSMVGISGGGWTTVMASAIDTRIKNSFPVAGSLPIFLRSQSRRDWGNSDQQIPQLYYETNYLELYVIGSSGLNRKQVQVFNKNDPCCFNGDKSKVYNNELTKKISELNEGFFEIIIDGSYNRHEISSYALKRISYEIENK